MIGSGAGAGECFEHGRKGGRIPPYGSTDQGGDQPITLADCARQDVPGAALAVAGTDGVKDTLPLQIDHNGVNGALVALRIESHAPNDLRAGLGSVLDQGSANGVAGEEVEVHRCGVVN